MNSTTEAEHRATILFNSGYAIGWTGVAMMVAHAPGSLATYLVGLIACAVVILRDYYYYVASFMAIMD